MSIVATKNAMLSPQRVASNEDTSFAVLPHTSTSTEEGTEYRIEIPGVDPSTVNVYVEDYTLRIRCERGSLNLPIPQLTDISKIKANILWGLLTLTIPQPEPLAPQVIKISINDSLKKAPVKTSSKFTETT